jgi:hypothetical protein
MVKAMSKLITYMAIPVQLPEHVRDTLKSIAAQIRSAQNTEHEDAAWSRYNTYEERLRQQFGQEVTRNRFEPVGVYFL